MYTKQEEKSLKNEKPLAIMAYIRQDIKPFSVIWNKKFTKFSNFIRKIPLPLK